MNWRNVGLGARAVDQRASILDASNLMEEAALDRYQFIRDGYLQRRESRVFDGDTSRMKDSSDAAGDDNAGGEAGASSGQVTAQPLSSEPTSK
jgi:phospholipid-binding lipoprotein MlaA